MSLLGDQRAILSSAPLSSADTVELGPTANGPNTLPPLPSVSAEAFYLDETGQWRAFNPHNFEARTVFSENTMAFTVARLESDMILLSGPSGSSRGGHAFNEGGFDGVAYPTEGPFRLLFADEKVLKANKVSNASALTTNWRQNIEALQEHFTAPEYDAVPRISEVRTVLARAVSNARAGLPPPAEVGRMITRFGEPTAITQRLARQLTSGRTPALPPSTEATPAKASPSLPAAAGPPPPAESSSQVVRFEKPEVEQYPRALMGPLASTPRSVRIEHGFQAAPEIFGWIKGALDEYGLNKEIEEALQKAEGAEQQYRTDNPDRGVLLAVEIKQLSPPGGDPSMFRARPTVAGVFPTRGYSEPRTAYNFYLSKPSVSDSNFESLPPVFSWLPPLKPPVSMPPNR